MSSSHIQPRRSYRTNKTPEDDQNMDLSGDYSGSRRIRHQNEHLDSSVDSVERMLISEKTVTYSYHRGSKNSSRINQSERSNETFSDQENEWNSENDSSRRNQSSFLNKSTGDRMSDKENASFNYDVRKSTKKRTEPAPAKNDYILMVLIVLGVIVGGYAIFINLPILIASKQHCVEFDELAKQFTNQEPMLWKSLRKGVESVLNEKPQRPSIFLLAYNDLRTSEWLMENILNATATCMQSKNPIKLDGNSVVGNHGDLIDKYKDQCKNSGIMYISNINRIKMPAAQMFHVFCDTIEPLVERAVIYLTIHIEQYERNIRPNQLTRLVETDLERYWHDTDANTLEALIARVTDQVFLLHPEKRLE